MQQKQQAATDTPITTRTAMTMPATAPTFVEQQSSALEAKHISPSQQSVLVFSPLQLPTYHPHSPPLQHASEKRSSVGVGAVVGAVGARVGIGARVGHVGARAGVVVGSWVEE